MKPAFAEIVHRKKRRYNEDLKGILCFYFKDNGLSVKVVIKKSARSGFLGI
jgi:hypothetical protein